MKYNLLTLFLFLTLTGTTYGQTVPSYVPTNGLVGWWPFNGNANDESGNGNNGTVNGPTLTADRFGNPSNAYLFHYGTDLICTSNSFNSPNNLSYSVWLKSSNIGFLLGFNNGQCSHGGQWDRTIIIDGTNQFRYYTYPGSQVSTTAASNIINNQWNHVVVTMGPGGSKLYANGILVASNLSQTTGENFIGWYRFGGLSPNDINNSVVGSLDDIGIWHRVLTQQEITALYNATNTNSNPSNGIASTLPTGISYQAVARDSTGQPLANRNATVRFTLRDSSIIGTAVYVETHAVTTNSLGLFTAVIGGGSATSGTYSAVNWMGPQKFLSVEMDSGNGFQLIGSQQLLSVPYSNVAGKSLESSRIKNASLPVFSGNAAAVSGGLQPGDMYRTSTGDLKIVY